ncbi:MAG: hypothetical protein ACRDGE_08980, partial [Candidatus Limnocylindria bacterium]
MTHDLLGETAVFTWDPRARVWLHERGPEDGAPPGPPLDDGAVATYFYDTNAGRWTSSILGPRGRVVSEELQSAYRMPYAIGIQGIDDVLPAQPKKASSRGGLIVGALALLLVLGMGGVFAQAVLAPEASAPPA